MIDEEAFVEEQEAEIVDEEVFVEEQEVLKAPKNDSCPYEKPDLSEVPWDVLSFGYLQEHQLLIDILLEVHMFVNGDTKRTPFHLLQKLIAHYGIKPLAIAFGYGSEKYSRGSWKLGFDGDYIRILKALLRHGDAFARGEEYDGEVIGMYTKGTSHIGAVMWCLVVSEIEYRRSTESDKNK